MSDTPEVLAFEQISGTDLEKLIQLVLFTPMTDNPRLDNRWGPTLTIMGDPGIGKTETVRALTNAFGMHLEVVCANQLRDDQLTAVPLPDGKGGFKFITFLPQLMNLMKVERGVLFIDELTAAKEIVQKPLMSLATERALNEFALPNGIRVICAANQAEDIGGIDLITAFVNKMTQVHVRPPTNEEHIRYSHTRKSAILGTSTDSNEDEEKKVRFDPVEAEERIKNLWPSVYDGIIDSVNEWLLAGGKVHEKPTQEQYTGAPWPSSRTLTYCKRYLAAGNILGTNPLILRTLLQGTIGPQASALIEFISNKNLPSADEILSGSWTIPASRADKVIWAARSINERIKSEKDKNVKAQVVLKAFKFVERCCELGLADAVWTVMSLTTKEGFTFDYKGPLWEEINPLKYTLMREFANTKGILARAIK